MVKTSVRVPDLKEGALTDFYRESGYVGVVHFP